MAQFTNQASLSYNGITVNSNIVTGELTPTLTATKTATRETFTSGDILTYVITLRNTGTLPFNGLTISDDLGAYAFDTTTLVPLTYTSDPVLYYIDGVLQGTPTVTAGPPMTITGINVPAGGDATIIYRVRANEFAPVGDTSSIVNTATITGAGQNEALTPTETVTYDPSTRLTILKALNPPTVNENGEITYTFTIQNYGDEAGADAGIVISDTFNPILADPLTVTLNGVTLTQAGNYTYDPASGLFTTTAGVITVPAATREQDPTTGVWSVTPSTTTVTVSSRI